MKNLAPQIFRKRLLIEGFYSINVDVKTISDFFDFLTLSLNLKTYGEPVIHHTGGVGKDENQGFDAFVPLIDSGIYLGIWANQQFLSLVIYTCKDFSNEIAVEKTNKFFSIEEAAFKSF